MDRTPHICACGDHAWLRLTKGFVGLIDPDNIPLAKTHVWNARPSHGNVYAGRGTRFRGKKKTVLLHRVICGPRPDQVVDHINGNGIDNRRCNLRPMTPSANRARGRFGTQGVSKYRGVSPRGGKWVAMIHRNRKQRYLGLFDSEEAAAAAYARAAREWDMDVEHLPALPGVTA